MIPEPRVLNYMVDETVCRVRKQAIRGEHELVKLKSSVHGRAQTWDLSQDFKPRDNGVDSR